MEQGSELSLWRTQRFKTLALVFYLAREFNVATRPQFPRAVPIATSLFALNYPCTVVWLVDCSMKWPSEKERQMTITQGRPQKVP